jgi:hypothetical protein
MNNFWTWLLLTVSVMTLSHSMPTPTQRSSGVMLVAVSRDAYMLGAGSFGKESEKGAVFVEPFAQLTSSGEWQSLPCFADRDGRRYADQHNACSKFEQEYLSKPHAYAVVSADGRGSTINAAPVTLNECWGYTGTGTYSGGHIKAPAIAASSTDFFSDSPDPQLLPDADAKPFLKAFAAAVPGGLDSSSNLKLFSLRLEGQDLALVQRTYVEPAGTKLIFAIGKMDQNRFQILHWKENVDDEEEFALGTVHLTSGRDFLITTVTDPEGQWFRVYGIQQGKLAMVYSGGGSSC